MVQLTTTPVAPARRTAFANLGADVSDLKTGEEVLEAAMLTDWDVRKLPLYTFENGVYVPIQDRLAVARNHPVTGSVDPIGIVSPRYQTVQNEELITFLDSLVDESGANYQSAGQTRGGRRVFVTMKMPDHMMIGGVDKVEKHLVVTSSHDGSGSFQVMGTPIRMECLNQLQVAIRQAGDNVFRARHTRNVTQMIGQAREALDLTFRYMDEFQAQAELMLNQEMTLAEFEKIVEREFGAPEDAAPATITRCDNKIQQMTDLFAMADTQNGIRGTVWGAFNALTEWYDHFSPVRGDNLRAEKAAFDIGWKQAALEMVRS